MQADLQIVKDWLHSGCPVNRTVVTVDKIVPDVEVQQESENALPALTGAPLIPSESQYPQCFHDVDLSVINDSRQWVQFCVFLAKYGFPCHDRFLEVVSTLAKWFAFVELHHLWPDRTQIKLLVKDFCLNKHNSFITRINNGQIDELITHAERVVDYAIESVTEEGKQLFAEIRWKRSTGVYPGVYMLEGLMSDNNLNKIHAKIMSYFMWVTKGRGC